MYDQAIAATQRALVLAATSGDVVLHALANFHLGHTCYAQGDYRRGIDCFGQTVASLAGAQSWKRFGEPYLPAVFSRAFLALCHAELGTFVEGSVFGEEGLQLATVVAHPGSLMWASWGSGGLFLCKGDLHRALPLLEHAVNLCYEEDLQSYFPRLAAALGAAYILGERVADAVSLLTQAQAQSIATERAHFEMLCSLPLSEAHMLTGRLEEAHALAARVLVLASERQERGYQAYALRLLGEIAAHSILPEVERAEAFYSQAFALADEIGMRPLLAHCHYGLGILYNRIGRPEQAYTELSAAIELYRAMEMTFWLERAEIALVQEREREN
jgi:tetratricopeptide (TPR) repeat protein